MRVLIVANGVLEKEIDLADWVSWSDLLIAADGGADHCMNVDIVPHVVVGDLDSISPSILERLGQEGKKILSYPVEKDFTDLELALKYAVDQGGMEIVVIGALGARWDMSVANFMLLGAEFLKNKTVRLLESKRETALLRGGETIVINGSPEDLISLIPLGKDAVGVTTQGLLFPLEKEVLAFAATRGVSNRMRSMEATVKLDSGLLLCIHQFDTLIKAV